MTDDASIIKHERVFAAPVTDAKGRRTLIGPSPAGMEETLAAHDVPRFRIKQIWHWIYHRGVRRFADMHTLPKTMIALLDAHFTIDRPVIHTEQRAADGTVKWLLEMADGQRVETVYIPEETRGTLCVSSQVGCTLACRFCHTGTQPLVRNLGAHEIVQQLLVARDALGEWPHAGEPADRHKARDVTNIVFMGMGEPLYNYANVAAAIRIFMDAGGLAISKRRITLSTSGVVPLIRTCGEELNVNLAISLHAPEDELRSSIMGINKKYPLADLMAACRDYPLEPKRRITFEYVMLKGVNDMDAHAHNLATLLHNIPAKVNLIPFNPWPGTDFECSAPARIRAFAAILKARGLDAPIRKTRGEDILAACGQLKSASMRKSRESIAAGQAADEQVAL